MSKAEKAKRIERATLLGTGLSALALLWGVVAQCLKWAGAIGWPWQAVWLPAVAMLCAGIAIILGMVVAMSFSKAVRR